MRTSCSLLAALLLAGCSGVPSRIELPSPLAGIEPLTVHGRLDGGEHITFGPFRARAQYSDAILERGGPLGTGARRGAQTWAVTVEREGIPIGKATCGPDGPPAETPPAEDAPRQPLERTALACTVLMPGGDTLALLEVRERAPQDSSVTWDGRLPTQVGSVTLEDRHLVLAGGAFLRGMVCLGSPTCTWVIEGPDDRVLAAVETNGAGWVFPAADLTAGEFDLIGIVSSILLLDPGPGAPPRGAGGP